LPALQVCTIIAKNYVAHARVLARSLAEADPGSRLKTLVIDDFGDYIDPAQEPFDLLTPAQIDCEPFIHMAVRYSVLELSTAVKPWLLRHLLAAGDGPVTYLDPDIRVYGSLARIDELATEHGVVLIPHNSRPIPADGRRPSQVDVMIAGIYNLGFVSLAPGDEVAQLLDWWADRLRRDCRVDPTWGYFVDQRWFDLVPGFVSDLAILRDPEFNIAYWNLHERRLEIGSDGYTVDGRPLAFFHFSGFDPASPGVLSRHQDRIDVADDPVLARLLAEYADAVIAEGHPSSRQWPYGFGAFGDGSRFDERLRDLFDEYASANGDEVASPFTLDGVRRFDAWLREPEPGAPAGISRALARVYETRPDVRGAFPDLSGDDRAGFLRWAVETGVSQEPLIARLQDPSLEPAGAAGDSGPGVAEPSAPAVPAARSAPAVAAAPSAPAVPDAPLRGAPWGANVIGDLDSGSEQGAAARALISALDAAAVRVLPVRNDAGDARDDRRYPARPLGDAPFAVNIVCASPERLPAFVQHAGAEFFAGRHTAGVWFWHGERFPPELQDRFALVEQVWVPSAHSAAAIEPASDVPVHVIRVPVAPDPDRARTRAELGLPEGTFLFVVAVDHRTGFERQNPLAAVAAFARAFAPGDGAGLVVVCRGTAAAPEDHARLVQAAARHPDVALLHHDSIAADVTAVTAAGDSYVSLHRAEAFGVWLAEAMWLGKPVIATAYSGPLEYLTVDNSRPVDHRLVPLGEGQAPLVAGGRWADPDLDQAAAAMRDFFEHRDPARRLGERAATDIRSRHAPEVAGRLLAERLDSIRATGRARRSKDPLAGQPPALARLPMRLARGPLPAAPGRARAARGQLREAVLRVIRPYTVFQQGVNADLVAALAELSRDVAATRDHVSAEWADLLAGARREGARLTEPAAAGVEELKRIITLQTDRDVYLALAELHQRHQRIGAEPGAVEDLGLTGFELRAFSQNGEDGVLAEILRRIGAGSRSFVEFGVESGHEGNCVYLADVAGWTGLFMEASEAMFGSLQAKYSGQPGVRTIRAHVTAANVERLFEQGSVPAEPDVLSIDVDGQDYWIWQAIDRYHPRVVVIEYNSALDPRRQLVQPAQPDGEWDGSDYYGASLGALEALARSKRYRLVHTDLSAVNAFFVREDLLGASFPERDQVAVRGFPNYYQRGTVHPPGGGGPYLDLESGKLVGDGRRR
jgi:glycosyltransferase involved in cell wall biosynthesis